MAHRITNPEQAFDFTQKALKMLRQLLRVLNETINAWKEFTSEEGDIAYFSTLISTELNEQSQNAQDSLRAINDIFKDLDKLQGKLLYHLECCLARADAVSYFPSVVWLRSQHADYIPIQLRLQMTVENRKAAQRSGIIAEFANSVRPK